MLWESFASGSPQHDGAKYKTVLDENLPIGSKIVETDVEAFLSADRITHKKECLYGMAQIKAALILNLFDLKSFKSNRFK